MNIIETEKKDFNNIRRQSMLKLNSIKRKYYNSKENYDALEEIIIKCDYKFYKDDLYFYELINYFINKHLRKLIDKSPNPQNLNDRFYDDLKSETYKKVFMALKNSISNKNVLGYLYRCIENTYKDFFKSKHYMETLNYSYFYVKNDNEDYDSTEDDISDELIIEDILRDRETKEIIHEFLKKKANKKYSLDDLDEILLPTEKQEKIAEKLHVSVANIKKIKSKLFKEIKERFIKGDTDYF